LAPGERAWLHKRQSEAAAEAAKSGAGTISLAAVRDLRTWHLSAISLLANIPKWGIVFFCPLIIDYMLGKLCEALSYPGAPSVICISSVPGLTLHVMHWKTRGIFTNNLKPAVMT